MVKALARVFRWQRMLDDGVCGSIEELARREKVGRAYMSRILRLTLLAPDIVEAILDGRQPEGMQMDDVLSFAGVGAAGGWLVVRGRHRQEWAEGGLARGGGFNSDTCSSGSFPILVGDIALRPCRRAEEHVPARSSGFRCPASWIALKARTGNRGSRGGAV